MAVRRGRQRGARRGRHLARSGQGLVALGVLGMVAAIGMGRPAPAWASGPFSADILERNLAIQYVKHSYKIYRSSEQADRHRRQLRRELYAHLMPRVPRIQAALAQAARQGIARRPLDLTLPLVEHDPSEHERVARPRGPSNLALKVPVEEGTYTLTFSVNAIPTRGVLIPLQKKLSRLLARVPVDDTAAPTPLAESPKLVRPQTFAVIGGKVGVLVASRVEAPPAVATALRPQLDALLGRAERHLKGQLHDPAWRKALEGPLVPLARAAAVHGRPLDAALFNVHGPLLDEGKVNLLRAAHDVGLVRIVALVAMKDYQWGTVNLHLDATLKAIATSSPRTKAAPRPE